ncbi:NUDIX domain-containing protein [Alteromonas gilva]|uniref:NUDIX domain-containing protein n=1 Tax=Alteromonas gilva TaxID=2987522 RepID=A0ABT5KYB3_9ALTE|nr:NUDIX domain-containing protein [Alteromonas gilva]MDC8829756.1 NUDIX domain-containing protein [Alteromonas gilva]
MPKNYCPRCGSLALLSHDGNQYGCEQCDFELFRNVAAAVGVVLVHQQHILLVKRSKAPQAGMWDLPGGFVNRGETAEQALRRECQEELAIQLDSELAFLGAWPNLYAYKELEYPTLDIFYTATLTNRPQLTADNTEVYDVTWMSSDACRTLDMAFNSGALAIAAYLRR